MYSITNCIFYDNEYHSWPNVTVKMLTCHPILESMPQFENGIMALVYVRSIARSIIYQKAAFFQLELAYGKLVL